MLSVPIGAFDIRLLWDYDYGWTIRTSILGSDGITQSELSEMKIEWSHTFVLLHHNIYVMISGSGLSKVYLHKVSLSSLSLLRRTEPEILLSCCVKFIFFLMLPQHQDRVSRRMSH